MYWNWYNCGIMSIMNLVRVVNWENWHANFVPISLICSIKNIDIKYSE